MNLPTSHLPESIKKTTRFMIIGTLGTCVQTGFFLLLKIVLKLVLGLEADPAEYTTWWYIAFGGGFILEMIPNYFCMCYYSFESTPNKKNIVGFIVARGINLVLQMIVLPLSKIWLAGMNDALISFIVIFVAGIANFVIQYFCFKNPEEKKA